MFHVVSKAPHYNPFLLFGLVLFVLGAGLCTTFTIQTTEGKWISYQILVGAGSAFIIQVVSLLKSYNARLLGN